jgi:hypothetical protein
MLDRRNRTVRGVLIGAMSLALLGAATLEQARACTTGVVSGRATPDGRPLLWKNRDTSQKNNQVVYSDKGKYAYVGVISAGSGGSVWMGANSAGFCIENSVIKDMPRGHKSGLGNGSFMKYALENCANVAEFEELLEKTNKTGRTTMSNYGVIDAEGGAAIFETGHVKFVKFDANCPDTAPHGYVVRSNFTMTGTGHDKLADGGDLNDIYSGGRFLRADALFAQAAQAGKLDHRFIIRHCARDMADEQCQPLPGSINGPTGSLPATVDTTSTVCRRTTVSVAVFQGVKPGENPLLTTMWVMLGEPAFSISVPCWVASGEVAPALLGGKRSPLCTTVLAIRNAHYGDEEDAKLLKTDGLASIWARNWAVEDQILQDTEQALARWRKKNAVTAKEVSAFHNRVVERAMKSLEKIHAEVVEPAVAGAGE